MTPTIKASIYSMTHNIYLPSVYILIMLHINNGPIAIGGQCFPRGCCLLITQLHREYNNTSSFRDVSFKSTCCRRSSTHFIILPDADTAHYTAMKKNDGESKMLLIHSA